MLIQMFHLDPSGASTLTLAQARVGGPLTLSLNSTLLGTLDTPDELATGRTFRLSDGSALQVQAVGDQLHVLRDGRPLFPRTLTGAPESSGSVTSGEDVVFTWEVAWLRLSRYIWFFLFLGGVAAGGLNSTGASQEFSQQLAGGTLEWMILGLLLTGVYLLPWPSTWNHASLIVFNSIRVVGGVALSAVVLVATLFPAGGGSGGLYFLIIGGMMLVGPFLAAFVLTGLLYLPVKLVSGRGTLVAYSATVGSFQIPFIMYLAVSVSLLLLCSRAPGYGGWYLCLSVCFFAMICLYGGGHVLQGLRQVHQLGRVPAFVFFVAIVLISGCLGFADQAVFFTSHP